MEEPLVGSYSVPGPDAHQALIRAARHPQNIDQQGKFGPFGFFPNTLPLSPSLLEKSPESSTSTPRARNTYCLFSGDKILFLKYTESEFPRGPPPPRCVHDAGQPPPPELLHETKDGHYTLRARQKTPL